MEHRIASAAFYAVMLIVVCACIASWPTLTWSPSWIEAIGTWFSGIATLSAVVAALWTANWQQREQKRIAQEQILKRSKIVYFRLNEFCTKVAMSFMPVTDDNIGTLVKMDVFKDEEKFLRGLLVPGVLKAERLSDGDLVFADLVSVDVAEIYSRLDTYEEQFEIILKHKQGPVYDEIYKHLMANAEQIRLLAISVSKSARTVLEDYRKSVQR